MFSRIRKRLTFANIVMTLALVFAMSGGAYAAKKYLITSTKQISPKVIAQLKGKNGTNGVNGTNGTNGVNGKDGAQGPVGGKGPAGEKGEKGDKGEQGLKGTTGLQGSVGPQGTTGTNGTNGTNGAAGEPWTPNNTLPSGATEKGAWAASGMPATLPGFPTVEGLWTSISFTIPLVSAPAAHVIAEGAKGTGGGTCPTTSEASKPEAEPGNLCIFEASSEQNLLAIIPANPAVGLGSGATGSVLFIGANKPAEVMFVKGTWAVMAG